MILHGALGSYDVRWRRDGFSYAEIVVRRYKKTNPIWHFITSFWPERVWVTQLNRKYVYADDFERMKPDVMCKLFQDAITEYEDYTTAWEQHHKNMNPDLNELLEKLK